MWRFPSWICFFFQWPSSPRGELRNQNERLRSQDTWPRTKMAGWPPLTTSIELKWVYVYKCVYTYLIIEGSWEAIFRVTDDFYWSDFTSHNNTSRNDTSHNTIWRRVMTKGVDKGWGRRVMTKSDDEGWPTTQPPPSQENGRRQHRPMPFKLKASITHKWTHVMVAQNWVEYFLQQNRNLSGFDHSGGSLWAFFNVSIPIFSDMDPILEASKIWVFTSRNSPSVPLARHLPRRK